MIRLSLIWQPFLFIIWALPKRVGLYVTIFFAKKEQKRISTTIPNAKKAFVNNFNR